MNYPCSYECTMGNDLHSKKFFLKISDENMRIILLNSTPFFTFNKPETLKEKQFLFMEARRWVYLVNEKMDKISVEFCKNFPCHHFYENSGIFFSKENGEMGKFNNGRKLFKCRFIYILNNHHQTVQNIAF